MVRSVDSDDDNEKRGTTYHNDDGDNRSKSICWDSESKVSASGGAVLQAEKAETCSLKDLGEQSHDGLSPHKYQNAHISRKCSLPTCQNVADTPSGSLCAQHRGKRSRCRELNCRKYAVKGGVCVKHGAQVPRCKVTGCDRCAVRNGVCVRHGAKVKRARCKVDGCERYSVKQGVCVSHGAQVSHPRCKHPGCEKYAQRSGVCVTHGARSRHPRCKHPGCQKYAKSLGGCSTHGESPNSQEHRTERRVLPNTSVEDKSGEDVRPVLCRRKGCRRYAKLDNLCLYHNRLV